jgi:ribonuclease T1
LSHVSPGSFALRLFTLLLALALALVQVSAWARGTGEPAAQAARAIELAELPPEARETVFLIRRGGPFPYERDGAVFGNFERALPIRERGYYREYTVARPGVRHRGGRRIVAGRGGDFYYTDDHYRTFKRIRE